MNQILSRDEHDNDMRHALQTTKWFWSKCAKYYEDYQAAQRVRALRESVGGWPAVGIGETIHIRKPQRFQQKP